MLHWQLFSRTTWLSIVKFATSKLHVSYMHISTQGTYFAGLICINCIPSSLNLLEYSWQKRLLKWLQTENHENKLLPFFLSSIKMNYAYLQPKDRCFWCFRIFLKHCFECMHKDSRNFISLLHCDDWHIYIICKEHILRDILFDLNNCPSIASRWNVSMMLWC